MDIRPITKMDLIKAFTSRPADAGAMPLDELVRRLDIALNQLKEDIAASEKRLPVSAANCLRGALIRCAQAINDPDVSEKINELVAITADISGI